MNCEISEALKRLAAEYGRATTQKERDRLTREIARVSYSQEADRAKSRRNSRQGAFDAAMLSLDEHMAKFDDPSKIATFSDGGKSAESVRNGGIEVPADVIAEALSRIPEGDRDFAQAVLDGKRWGDMGMPKATFYRRLKKVEERVRPTP